MRISLALGAKLILYFFGHQRTVMLLLMGRSSFLDSLSYIPSLLLSAPSLPTSIGMALVPASYNAFSIGPWGTLSVFGRVTTKTGKHRSDT
jgi:hypothetical protein